MIVDKMTNWVKKELAKSKNEFAYSVDTILFLTTIREKYVKMYEIHSRVEIIFQSYKDSL